jgi:ribonuclease T2
MLAIAGRIVAATVFLSLMCSVSAWARNKAGDFHYYMLVLSWSPTYCEMQREHGRDGGRQCSGPRRYAFVLHGLWPQYEDGWPQNCLTRERPWVSDDLINRMLDIMPSRSLVIHEYKKHGTCTGLSPEAYFNAARKLYESLKIPQRYSVFQKPLAVSPKTLKEDFLTANPALQSKAIALTCSRNKLRDLRVCFSRDLKPRPCSSSKPRRKSCYSEQVVLPPSRKSPVPMQ